MKYGGIENQIQGTNVMTLQSFNANRAVQALSTGYESGQNLHRSFWLPGDREGKWRMTRRMS